MLKTHIDSSSSDGARELSPGARFVKEIVQLGRSTF